MFEKTNVKANEVPTLEDYTITLVKKEKLALFLLTVTTSNQKNLRTCTLETYDDSLLLNSMQFNIISFDIEQVMIFRVFEE